MTSVRGIDPFVSIVQSYPIKFYKSNNIVSDNNNTIYQFIKNNKNYSIMYYLLNLANLNKIFDNIQFNSTFFLICDQDILKNYNKDYFINIKSAEAHIIINHLLLDTYIDLRTLSTLTDGMLNTYDKTFKLHVRNYNNTILINGNAQVIEEKQLDNGKIIFLNAIPNRLVELR